MTINENIRNFRNFRNISQQTLSEKLSVSKSTVSNWENGVYSPPAEICGEICRLLDVTPNELFGWEKCREYEAWKLKIAESTDRLKEIYNKIDAMKKEAESLEKDVAMLEKMDDKSAYEILKSIDKSDNPMEE